MSAINEYSIEMSVEEQMQIINNSKVNELKSICKIRKLKKYSKLRKQQLIDLLTEDINNNQEEIIEEEEKQEIIEEEKQEIIEEENQEEINENEDTDEEDEEEEFICIVCNEKGCNFDCVYMRDYPHPWLDGNLIEFYVKTDKWGNKIAYEVNGDLQKENILGKYMKIPKKKCKRKNFIEFTCDYCDKFISDYPDKNRVCDCECRCGIKKIDCSCDKVETFECDKDECRWCR